MDNINVQKVELQTGNMKCANECMFVDLVNFLQFYPSLRAKAC